MSISVAPEIATRGVRPRPPRLLFVINDAPFFISHRLPIAVAARRAGYEVHIAVPPDDVAVLDLRAGGYLIHELPLDRRSTSPLGELRLFFALCALYRRVQPVIVHHVTVKPILYGSLARRLTGGGAVVNAVPGLGYVFLSRGLGARVRRWLVERVYGLALSGAHSIAIFQNPDDLELFVSRRMVRRDRTVVIRGSGVDLNVFPPFDEPEGTPRVVVPSRMLWDKGIGEFVEAARLLLATGIRAEFVLVGGCDANRSSIDQRTLERWHAEGVVQWWGRRTDMPAVLQSAAVVCLPSYREGVPKALLEAAATGRAIVTTDVPGCREVVRHGENGLLVPLRDSVSLAEALRQLLADPERRRRMGRASRRRAEQEFSVDAVVRETLLAYRLVHAWDAV